MTIPKNLSSLQVNMTSTSFKEAWRLCFLCKQSFGATHHRISGEDLLKAIRPHLPSDRKEELLGKTEVRICCRHFVFNIKGDVLYSCKKRPVHELSSDSSMNSPQELVTDIDLPQTPPSLPPAVRPIFQEIVSNSNPEPLRTNPVSTSEEITRLNIYINASYDGLFI